MTTLMMGMKSAEVGNWQRFLAELDYLDSLGNVLTIDEDFGPKTEWATKNYQASQGLTSTGNVDPPTNMQAQRDGFLTFIQAKNCRVLWPVKRAKVDLIVVHTMEHPEKPKTAFDVASWFAGANAPIASAHFCLDDTETIQCVRETDVAWHAPGVNNNGIGIEHAGFASQTLLQWQDDYSLAVLERSAQLAARLCKRWNIPVVRLPASELNKGGIARGFCGHIDATFAFSSGKGHTDPGPSYPWNSYLSRVQQLLKEIQS